MTVRRPPPIELDVADVEALLERIEPRIDKDDHVRITSLVSTLLEVARMARQRGATIARLLHMLGQRSSEKTADVVGAPGNPAAAVSRGDADSGDTAPGHLDAAASNAAPPENDADPAAPSGRPKRRGHGRIPASAYQAEAHAVPHPTLSPGQACPACARGALFALREPQSTVRILGQAPLVALRWECARLRCNACSRVHTAPLPEDARGPKYSESAASMMVVLRYGMGMPLHRLEVMQSMMGIPVPASTQWEAARDHLADVLPVYGLLVVLAANAPLVHNDDTHVKILALMGKGRDTLVAAGDLEQPERTGLFTTGIVAETVAGPVALFSSGRQHAGENLADLLEHRDPSLLPPIHMCDGLDRNRSDEHIVQEANCIAHGRRQIVDEIGNHPAVCAHILGELAEIYANDKVCREGAITGAERLALHQRKSGPILTNLRTWIAALFTNKEVEPNSGLGGALTYMLKRWERFTLFLRVADAPLDNNAAERVLKMAIRQRRASLFYRTRNGAYVGDVYTALLATTQLHGGDPFRYLEALFTHHKAVEAAPHEWLPWNYEATLASLLQRPVRAAA